MQVRLNKTISGLMLFCALTPMGARADYSYGGSCLSQGQWTQSALQISAEIKSTLQRFKDDPNCKGLESIYEEVRINQNFLSEEEQQVDKTKGEVSSLDALIKSGEGSSKGATMLLGKIIDGAKDNKEMQKGKTRALNTGLRSMGAFFDKLPDYDSCLIGHPGLVGPILSNSVKMLASYSSANGGNLNAFGDTLNKFVNMLRERHFTSSIAKLDDMQLTNTISCLIESATENYCKAKDAYEMIELAEKEPQLYEESKENPDYYNPLEGYFILTRETKVLSDWLQNVMFGVLPRTNADSTYKNKVIDNVNEFLQDENSLYGYYSIQAIEYQSLTTQESKKNHLLELVKGLTSYMVGGSSFAGSQRRGDVNFFTRSMLAEKIPFYLIGLNQIPDAVAANDQGRFVMDKWTYMEQGGRFLPEFNNPDLLLESIEVRLKDIIEVAKANASSYLQKRLIVDKQNLVDEAIVSQQISPYEAFERISRYLNKLVQRANHSKSRQFYGMVPSLMETNSSIKKVLELFDTYFTKSEELLALNRKGRSSIAKRQALSEMAMDIIATVYVEFNVILQRDTYIMNRLLTYVKYDYMFFTKQNEDLSDYQKDLLVIAGKQLVELFGSAYEGNPAKIRMDLANAQVINRTNILALEEVFRDSLFNIIARYRRILQGKGDGFGAFVWDFEKRLGMDSFSSEYQKAMALDYLFKANPEARPEDAGNPYDMAIVGFNPAKWFYRSIFNSGRYRYVGRIFERADFQMDDQYGSLEQLKSKLCVQTLGFSNYYEYFYLCKDSNLEGIKAYKDKDLDMSYNKTILPYLADDHYQGVEAMREHFDDNVCALRNFRRKNHAYWLLKDVTK